VDEDTLLLHFYQSRCQVLSFDETHANTEAVVFKLKLGPEPVRQRSHELKAQPSIFGRIETFRETNAVVGHFHQERTVVFGLSADVDLHRQARRMRILAGVGEKLGGNEPDV
jgi:hypothetical protein